MTNLKNSRIGNKWDESQIEKSKLIHELPLAPAQKVALQKKLNLPPSQVHSAIISPFSNGGAWDFQYKLALYSLKGLAENNRIPEDTKNLLNALGVKYN